MKRKDNWGSDLRPTPTRMGTDAGAGALTVPPALSRPRRAYRGWMDAGALSIHRHMNAKLNELPKQIFMLLPLLLLLLLLLYVLTT